MQPTAPWWGRHMLPAQCDLWGGGGGPAGHWSLGLWALLFLDSASRARSQASGTFPDLPAHHALQTPARAVSLNSARESHTLSPQVILQRRVSFPLLSQQ